MTFNVKWLEVASHTVKLASGMVVLGIKKGNIEMPAVKMTPAINNALLTNAIPAFPLFEKNAQAKPATIPKIGAIIVNGYSR